MSVHTLASPQLRRLGSPDPLNPPYGGKLVDLMASAERAEVLVAASVEWPSLTLSPRQLCDLELLLNGSFSPLTGYLGRADHEAVCQTMRLSDGRLWPIPVTLELPRELAEGLRPGVTSLALRDAEGLLLAALHVREVWEPDRGSSLQAILGTTDQAHPSISRTPPGPVPVCVAGQLEGLQLPPHHDFRHLRRTPAELRAEFAAAGWRTIAAFQTRNPLHRAHYEMMCRAAHQAGTYLLLHPVVGMTKPGDIDHYTRVRCYQALLHRFPEGRAKLALLELAMWMAGPREALLHAIIRKNHGCSHFIVGRDHAGAGLDSTGLPFYRPLEAQELLLAHEAELGIGIIPFPKLVYVEELAAYAPEEEVPAGMRTLDISGTELRHRLAVGDPLPSWFTFPEIAAELKRAHPPRGQQGFAVFFTGLSGAGKSTLANVVQARLLEAGGRRVTMLDGDQLRHLLSPDLTFSKEHRDLHVRRVGYLASEVAKHGGVALCALIAPYELMRQAAREMVERHGAFVLVHVATPLEVCERRDRKGLYAKARAGLLGAFTGVSDPYEVPERAELTVDTTGLAPEAAAEQIIAYLQERGFLTADATWGTDMPEPLEAR